MNGDKILDALKRYRFTRRYSGRRAITPMRSKLKKIQKTRGHKVEKKHVPLFKHPSSFHDGEREKEDESQCCQHTERTGDQDSNDKRGEENQKEHTCPEQKGNSADSTESIHPGPVQTLPRLPEHAYGDDTQEETIEAEQLL